jgi:hypothetical protein
MFPPPRDFEGSNGENGSSPLLLDLLFCVWLGACTLADQCGPLSAKPERHILTPSFGYPPEFHHAGGSGVDLQAPVLDHIAGHGFADAAVFLSAFVFLPIIGVSAFPPCRYLLVTSF